MPGDGYSLSKSLGFDGDAAVDHLDWSLDSAHLQANTRDGRRLVFSVAGGRPEWSGR